MPLAFDVEFDDVEENRVDGDEENEREDVLQQRAKVRSRLPVVDQIGDLAPEELHGRCVIVRTAG